MSLRNDGGYDLQVPFAEKDAAKRLGARWDPARKTWYVPAGRDVSLFVRWSNSLDDGAASAEVRNESKVLTPGFRKAARLICSTPTSESIDLGPLPSPRPNVVCIWCDGAAEPNPGQGGWGAVIQTDREEREIFGGEPHTTNNRMELMGAIKALEALEVGCRVTVHSDSQYVVKGMTSWLPRWTKKNFKGVKNSDLWQRLAAASVPHTVEWKWVRGHTGDAGNERADRLAMRGILRK